MRAVEWSLRAFCAHLGFKSVRAKIKKSGTIVYTPVEYSEWDKILSQLPDVIDAKLAKIKRGAAKQKAQEFYHPVLQDIKSMKDAWRNHVMHTRGDYTFADVLAVRSHVERIMGAMQKWGISESKQPK